MRREWLNEAVMTQTCRPKKKKREKEVRGKRNEYDDVERGVGHECGVASADRDAYGMRDCVHVLSATMFGISQKLSSHLPTLSDLSQRCGM